MGERYEQYLFFLRSLWMWKIHIGGGFCKTSKVVLPDFLTHGITSFIVIGLNGILFLLSKIDTGYMARTDDTKKCPDCT